MEKKLIVTPSPHLKASKTTAQVMLDVIIALMPAVIAAGIIFGLRALVLIAVCAMCCVVFEYLFCIIVKKPNTTSDLSAVVTGVILGLNLPATLPIWMAVIGSFLAIVVVKNLFGGLGQNFANPALVGRIVLMVSFTGQMTKWVQPFYYRAAEAVTTATPLAVASSGEGTMPSYLDMFLGVRAGSLGETCVLALLIGFVWLLARKIISPVTPVAFVGTVFVCTWLLGGDPLAAIMSGGLMLGAIFMATDYATTPIMPAGKLMFGIGAGLLTVLIRNFAGYPEGVSFGILLMNILTPYFDRWTTKKAFGGGEQ